MPRSIRTTLRTAETHESRHIHALITANLVEGHLLPRTLDELTVHVSRFVVATRGRKIVGCGELAPLSPQVAEEFLRGGELEQAVRIFQKTLEMDPDNVNMRTRLAEGP